jgi:predicted Kef-type K+ transport protein
MEIAWIAAAFASGLAMRAIGLPTLVGYLAAGFALNAAGAQAGPGLEHVAHAGVLLLLFSVGLKLRIATLVRPEVLLGGALQLLLAGGAAALALLAAGGLAGQAALLLGVGLAFSSTVMAAKVLEDRAEIKAFHGRSAIGILILQDLVAVALIGVGGGDLPSPWALAWLTLPFLRAAIVHLLRLSGHGDLLVLYGVLLAVVVGGGGFASVGLSAELGAIVLGALVSGHPRSGELADALWGVRELSLVGFFLSVGMGGLPAAGDLLIAAALLLALPVKAALFFGVLLAFRLRARTAFLAALALASYSEFALIVASSGARGGWLPERWLPALALALAASFAIAAPLNAAGHRLYARLEALLVRLETRRRHADDEPISLDGAKLVVFGMGRVGTGAYDHLSAKGARVAGLDSDPIKVARQREAGRRVLYADAEDIDLWHRLDLGGVEAVLLALPDLDAKRTAAAALAARRFPGLVTATTAFPEEASALAAHGVRLSFDHYERAGESFAQRSWEALQAGPPTEVDAEG